MPAGLTPGARVGLALRSVAVAAAIGLCRLACAQSAADISHLGDRLQPPPAAPSLAAPLDIPDQGRQQVAPAGSDNVHFVLSGISFDGNTVLPERQLQALAAAYLTHEVTLAQLYELAGRVTAVYRQAGYILVQAVVPAQQVRDGRVRLQIIEGYVDQVRIQGDAGGARGYLERYGRRIVASRPLTSRVLERELLLAEDLSGLEVRAVLTPSPGVPAAADLTLVVSRRRVDAFAGADNRGSRYLGPYELTAGAFLNDPLGSGGRLGINGAVTPDSGPDLAYGGATFEQPLGADGADLLVGGNYAATEPGDFLRALGTTGRAVNGNAALSYPLVRSRDFNLRAAVDLAYHDVRSGNALIQPLFDDHVRTAGVSLFANALDGWGGYSSVTLDVIRGLPVLGATGRSDPEKSRSGASAEFTRADLDLRREQPFGSRVSVLLELAGQTSFGSPLLASEQFTLGGDNFDRAFDPSEASGDSALAGRVELRWNLLGWRSGVSGLQPYGFFEQGWLWQADAAAGAGSQSLSSAGLGARIVFDRVRLVLEWAKPMSRDAPGLYTDSSRVFFSLTTDL